MHKLSTRVSSQIHHLKNITINGYKTKNEKKTKNKKERNLQHVFHVKCVRLVVKL